MMVDGTGMCGGCRVLTTQGTQFACVDGPEFDAHQVDFDLLIQRNRTYLKQETESLQRFLEHPEHDLELVRESCRLEQKHPEVRCEAHIVMSANSPTPPLSNKERVKIPRQHMPEQDADRRRTKLRGSEPGPDRAGRHHRGPALPSVHLAQVHGRLPGRSQGQGLRRADRRGRLPEGRGQDPRGQHPAGDHRPGLPPGDPVRGMLHPGQQVRARGHRLPRAVRGRLRARGRARSGSPRSPPRPARRWPSSAADPPA